MKSKAWQRGSLTLPKENSEVKEEGRIKSSLDGGKSSHASGWSEKRLVNPTSTDTSLTWLWFTSVNIKEDENERANQQP